MYLAQMQENTDRKTIPISMFFKQCLRNVFQDVYAAGNYMFKVKTLEQGVKYVQSLQ